MIDRFLAWFGAAAVLTGVAAGMVAGAGVGWADQTSDGGNGTSTSESTKTVQKHDDSADTTNDKPAESKDTPKDAASTDEDAADKATEKTTDIDDPADAKDADDALPVKDKKSADRHETPTTRVTVDRLDSSDLDDADDHHITLATTVDEPRVATPTPQPVATAQHRAVTVSTPDGTQDTTAAVAFAAAADEPSTSTAAAPPFQGVLSVIGTVVFNLYNLASKVLGGPPILPPGSTVTVRTSSLHLDCGCNDGDGLDVQADWYVPKTDEGEAPPDRLIYLQHGLLARGPWYSYTAAALAEQTHSIVVAPSITSNFFASDGCWLGATPMHQAMARLFDDDNTALADSAAAAGYTGALPDRVVLVGHSLGGGAVIGIAGAMADNGTQDRLAGVLMLDGVPMQDNATEEIERVNPDIPIYQLAAPKYFWNQFGVGSADLLAARPGQFIGVTLTNGSHVDFMRGGNPLIQFGEELVAGFVRPENGDAAQILMIDYVNDMFAGVKHDPITEPFTVDTPHGPATAVPLPNDLSKQFFLNPLQAFTSLGNGFFTMEPACVRESMSTCSASMAA
jgi:hypothetical protein